MDKFYVTTPIYYVNDVPHIGHAYTTIAADVLARYHRRLGDNVFFLTGTDEHGANVAQAAAAHGKSPLEYCDGIAGEFKRAWRTLNICNDFFVRTTDPYHERAVQAFMQRLYDRGFIEKGRYEGRYCVSCERYYGEDELVNGLCPIHRREAVWYAEDNYFFQLSKFAEPLARALTDENDPNHFEVSPPARRNEVLGKIRVGLDNISVSRATLPWGIPLPFDSSQTTYVWVDALLNYITALGFGDDEERLLTFWPADVQLMAKDILWFHAIVWPAMLLAAGLPTPRRVFAHGFFTIEGQKMSKTLGNVIRPDDLVEKYGVDGTRYLVLSAFPFGTDGDISLANFTEKYNADLANDLGNLLNRTISMVNRYFGGIVPEPAGEATASDAELKEAAGQAFVGQEAAINNIAFSDGLASVWQLISRANKYVEENAPWALAKTNQQRLARVLYNLLETLRLLAHAIAPFMPGTATVMAAQLGVDVDSRQPWRQSIEWGGFPTGGTVIKKPIPLFPKIQ